MLPQNSQNNCNSNTVLQTFLWNKNTKKTVRDAQTMAIKRICYSPELGFHHFIRPDALQWRVPLLHLSFLTVSHVHTHSHSHFTRTATATQHLTLVTNHSLPSPISPKFSILIKTQIPNSISDQDPDSQFF